MSPHYILHGHSLLWVSVPFSLIIEADVQCMLQFSSVTQSCLTLGDPWTAARQASLSFTITQSLLKLMSIELLIPSNHLILGHPVLLLLSGEP